VNLRKDHYRDASITFERYKPLMPALEQRKAVNHGVPVCSAFVEGGLLGVSMIIVYMV
jgi:hypothetical protein